jgi:L-threonylcarbamoyladenylate synthase
MAGFEADIKAAVEILRKGGTILYPTDTIWGIGCNAADPVAVEKVFQLKNRPAEKSMIILLAHERDIVQYVASLDFAVFDLLESQTKPTTVIYDNAVNLPDNLVNQDGSIAIRVVQDEFCKHLIKRLQHPLVSTSANLSGQPSPENFALVTEEIKAAVDYVVQYKQDIVTKQEPSTILRWHTDGTHTVIRP